MCERGARSEPVVDDVASHRAVRSLIRRHRHDGCVPLSEVEAVARRLGDGDEVEATLIMSIQDAGLDVEDDCSRVVTASALRADRVADLTADTLSVFLDEIGRVPLLTADEEIELAKRIEAGDQAARGPDGAGQPAIGGVLGRRATNTGV